MLAAGTALRCTCCLQGRGQVEAPGTFACNLLDRGRVRIQRGVSIPTQVSLLSLLIIYSAEAH